ncbi:MAG: hypothetical protein Q3X80_09225 [Oscillospiraceae bacterium]|nr:hypothetical protein [Oscillospiraceae bacterium]
MKKLIPVLLSLLMALAMTATALAATVYTEGALHYTIADESITITGYFGKDAAVTVPASIAGIPVNTIAKGAFTGNDNVKTVDLPDTITAVEEGAFASGITVNYNSNVNGGNTPDDNKPDDNKPNNGGSGADTGTVDVDNSGTAGDTTGTTGGTGGAEDTGIDEGTVSVDDLPDSADSQTGAQDSAAVPQQSAGLTWLWVLLGAIAVAAIIGIVVTRKKKH